MTSTVLSNTRLVAALLVAGAIGGAGVGAFNALHLPASAALPVLALAAAGPAAPPMALPDFSQITERYGPSVVNISVTGMSQVSNDSPLAQGEDNNDGALPGGPLGELLRRFQQGQGHSGTGRSGPGAPQEPDQQRPTRG